MPDTAIDALSPLDGRYAGKLAAVRQVFSEAGLMRERVRVECAWFLALAAGPAAAALGPPAPPPPGLPTPPAEEPARPPVGGPQTNENAPPHHLKKGRTWAPR